MRAKQFLVRAVGLTTGIFVLASLSLAQDDRSQFVDMGYEFTWKTNSAELRVNPVRVRLTNELGKDDEGILTWSSSSQKISIPVQLPKGSEKIYELNISSHGYGQGNLSYNSPARTPYIPITMSVDVRPNLWKVAVVSDSPGGFLDIRQPDGPNKAWSNLEFKDFYVKPGEAPTRSIGYADMDFIFLGEGAERLSDAEVNAIKGATLAGSRLFFMGGAGKPIFSDVRWSDVLPVQVTGQRVSPRVQWLDAYSQPPQDSVLVSTANPLPVAQIIQQEGGQVLFATRGYGLGTSSFLAFDLSDGALRKWRGKKGLILSLSKSLPASSMHQSMRFLDGQNYDPYGYLPTSSVSQPIANSSLPKPELPSTLTILGVLGLYVVLVVPINLLLMRKLGKGELAWITAPIISLAFAGVLFNFSKELYASKSAKSTTGTLYVAEGSNLAFFKGKQELFIARAGTYDFGLKGVELIESNSGINDYEPKMTDEIDTIDVGELIVPAYKASNLDFLEFDVVQLSSWTTQPVSDLKATYVDKSRIRVMGSITNRTQVSWKSLSLLTGAGNSLSNLEPGKTWTVDGVFPAPNLNLTDGIFPLKFSAPLPGIGANIGERVPDVKIQLSLNIDVTALRGRP